MAKPNTLEGAAQVTGGALAVHRLKPNVNVGSGSIPTHRQKHKPHKSQPHAKTKKKRPTQRIAPTPKSKVDPVLESATNLQFAKQDAAIKQEESDIPGWYDDYLRKLQGLQTQTTEQYKGLQNQASTLAEAVHGSTPEGQKATESRNNIVAAIQGALLQQGGAAFTRNQEMAGVAGLQKTVRQGKLADSKTTLAGLKGDFATKYKSDKAQTDFENQIAAKEFGIKAYNATTDRITATTKPKTETTYDKEFSKQAAKYGRTPKQWEAEGPKGRAKIIHRDQVRTGPHAESLARIERKEQIKQAAKHGYSYDDWMKLPEKKRASIINPPAKSKNGGTGKDGTGGANDNTKPGTARSRARKEVAQWNLDSGVKALVKKGTPRNKVRDIILKNSKAPDDPALVNAIIDAQYDHHLSRETARKLHKRGYSVRDIADALNTPTFTQWRRRQAKKQKHFEDTFVHKHKSGKVPKHHPTGPGGQGVT